MIVTGLISLVAGATRHRVGRLAVVALCVGVRNRAAVCLAVASLAAFLATPAALASGGWSEPSSPKSTTQVRALDTATVTIPGGHTKAVSLKLNGTGRKLLSRFRRLKVALVVSAGPVPARRVIARKIVTFVASSSKSVKATSLASRLGTPRIKRPAGGAAP